MASAGSSSKKGSQEEGRGSKGKRKSFWNPPCSQPSPSKARKEICKIGELLPKQENEVGALVFRVTGRALKPTRSSGDRLLFNGIDETGEIGFIAFRADAHRFDGLIKTNHVYEMRNFQVKAQIPDYVKITGFANQVWINEATEITEKDDSGLPEIPLNLVELKAVRDTPAGTKIDVMGIVCDMDELVNGGIKLDITITDAANEESEVVTTLWDYAIKACKPEMYSVFCVKGGTVSNFYGSGEQHSIKCNFDPWINPDNESAKSLKEWFDKEQEERQSNSQQEEEKEEG